MNRLSEEQFPSFGMQHPPEATGHGIPKTLPPLVRIHPFTKINRRVLYDKYKNYQIAFYTAAVLAAVALLCELAARRPVAPEGWAGRKEGAGGSLASRSRCGEAQDVSSYGA